MERKFPMSKAILPRQFFSPDSQSAFWSSLKPEMNACFEAFEKREDWTWQQGEMPMLFQTLGRSLVRIAKTSQPEDEARARPLLGALIAILACVPLRVALSGLAWLEDGHRDQQNKARSGIGWGALCYLHAQKVINEKQEEAAMLVCCELLVARVEVTVRAELATDLFSRRPDWI